MTRYLRAFVMAAVMITPLSASAAPYTLTLDHAVLSDGGEWTGYFTWNGDDSYDWLLVAFGGNLSSFPEVTLTPENSLFGGASDTLLMFDTADQSRTFVWQFADSILDGSADFLTGTGSAARELGEFTGTMTPYRTVTSGGGVTSGDVSSFGAIRVPEPTTSLLLGLGMLGLAGYRRLTA